VESYGSFESTIFFSLNNGLMKKGY